VRILGIDPGNVQSAYVVWDTNVDAIFEKGILENDRLLEKIVVDLSCFCDKIVCEMIACYGMPVGKTTFDTCVWVGRFTNPDDVLVYRKDIMLHFCHSARGKDSNIRQALIDRFGAPGTKKAPGKLYGVSKDIW